MDVASLMSCAQDYSREALRQKLLQAFERLLVLSQTKSSGTWTSYDETFLISALANIDWRQVCREFDHFLDIQDSFPSSSRSSFRSTNSPLLNVLLECFEDPSIWPCACASSLFVVLWEVLCSSGRSFSGNLIPKPVRLQFEDTEPFNWTPSQARLLNHMTNKILRQNPAMLNISFWTQNASSLFHDEHFTAQSYEIVVLVIRHWAVEFPSKQILWLTLLANAMVAIDEKEFLLKQERNFTKHSVSQTGDWATTTRCSKRRRISNSNLRCLHDEFSDGDHLTFFLSNQNDYVLKSSRLSQSSRISHEDVLKHPISCETETLATGQSLRSLWRIEAICIEMAIFFSLRFSKGWILQYPTCQSDPVRAIFQHFLEVIRNNSHSLTVKLTTVLLSHVFIKQKISCSSGGSLVHFVWSKASTSNNTKDFSVYVDFFTELLSISSMYFNAKSMLPILSSFLSEFSLLLSNFFHDKMDAITKNTNVDQLKIYLRCFASLIIYNNNIINLSVKEHGALKEKEEIDQRKVMLLSICEMIIKLPTYVRLYFFDFFCSKFKAYALHNDFTPRSLYDCCTSNISDYSLRTKVMNRFGLKEKAFALKPFLGQNLSCIVQKIYTKKTQLSESIVALRDSSLNAESVKSSTAIDLFDNNILLNVFSFLNFKRLLKIQLVSKRFKDIADDNSLWYDLYSKRFKCDKFIQMPQTHDNIIVWKRCFRNHFIAENVLRSSYSITGNCFKRRICEHINCYKILPSSKALEIHNKKYH